MNSQQAKQAIAKMTFGIEIECRFPRDTARSLGIMANSSNWSRPHSMNHIQAEDGEMLTDWLAGYDSTIRCTEANQTGIEFKSKILKGNKGFESVVRFFKWLNHNGASVDASCGLHIHLGVKEMVKGQDIDGSIETILKVLKSANSAKTAIFAQSGSARRYFEGGWAKARTAHLRSSAEERAKDKLVPCFGCKYFFINTRNIDNGFNGRKATVEFRALAGTTNYLKVLNHLSTCLTIAHTAMVIKRASWEGRNQTADKGYKAFDSLAKYMSNADHLTQFPIFNTYKRKMFKVGRLMAEKFVMTANRWATNGRVDLEQYR